MGSGDDPKQPVTRVPSASLRRLFTFLRCRDDFRQLQKVMTCPLNSLNGLEQACISLSSAASRRAPTHPSALKEKPSKGIVDAAAISSK